MTHGSPTIAEEVDQYLRTGHHDMAHAAWPGDILQRARLAHEALRGALVGEVKRRASGRAQQPFSAKPPRLGTVGRRSSLDVLPSAARGVLPRLARWARPRVRDDAPRLAGRGERDGAPAQAPAPLRAASRAAASRRTPARSAPGEADA